MKAQLRFALPIIVVLFGVQSHAKRAVLKRDQHVRIVYHSPSWNKDPRKIETAFLVVRDSKTGKIARITLEETEPDSSRFSGRFSVSFAGDSTEPDIFVPPQDQHLDERSLKEFSAQIQRNAVSRKPVVMKVSKLGDRTFEVYDTREQAQAALKASAELNPPENRNLKEYTPKQDLETAAMAERRRMMDRLAKEASDRESERQAMEKMARKGQDERLKEWERLSPADKAKRSAEAKGLAKLAMDAYAKNDYAQSQDLFKKASDLDPTDKSFAFYYGVSLYRLDRFNEALVQIHISKDDPSNMIEKNYYSALIHFRLKELDRSLAEFRDVKAKNDPVLSPSAGFYEGIILMSQEKLEEAKNAFEYVVDNSKDPALDQQADDYIEKILQLAQAKKMDSQRLTVSGTFGLTYDSNILLAPNGQTAQGSTVDKGGGLRLLASGSADYRYYRWGSNDLNAKVTSTYFYSLKTIYAKADPFLAGLSLPYTHKGTWGSKGHKLTIAPGTEALFMDPNAAGSRNVILNSYFLGVENLFVMNPKWFANYIFEYRSDVANVGNYPQSTGINDLSAKKYTFKTQQILFVDDTKKRAVILSGGGIFNMANGSESAYTRYEAGFNFTAPIQKWNASWMAGLTAYYLTFPTKVPNRHDTNVTVMAALSKPVNEWLTAGVMANYTTNASDDANSAYNKYTVLTTATFNLGM